MSNTAIPYVLDVWVHPAVRLLITIPADCQQTAHTRLNRLPLDQDIEIRLDDNTTLPATLSFYPHLIHPTEVAR